VGIGRHRVDIGWTFSGYRVAGGESGTGGFLNLSKVGRQKNASALVFQIVAGKKTGRVENNPQDDIYPMW
jgi:hypothetical protein